MEFILVFTAATMQQFWRSFSTRHQQPIAAGRRSRSLLRDSQRSKTEALERFSRASSITEARGQLRPPYPDNFKKFETAA